VRQKAGAPGERYQVVVHVDAGGAGGSRAAGPGRPRGWSPRFRGNVPAAGVRCQPRGGAPRSRRPAVGDRRADAHDPAGVAPGPTASGSWLPLSGLRTTVRPGTSPSSLGARGPDDALEPCAALPPTPSSRARGGVSGRAAARRRAAVPRPERTSRARGTTFERRALRRRRCPPGAARGGRPAHRRADGNVRLAGRAAGRGPGARCPAPAGDERDVAPRPSGTPTTPRAALRQGGRCDPSPLSRWRWGGPASPSRP
jgi:hypothetical protein